jgi:hypothetical protein
MFDHYSQMHVIADVSRNWYRQSLHPLTGSATPISARFWQSQAFRPEPDDRILAESAGVEQPPIQALEAMWNVATTYR